jgi:hypothetical protein
MIEGTSPCKDFYVHNEATEHSQRMIQTKLTIVFQGCLHSHYKLIKLVTEFPLSPPFGFVRQKLDVGAGIGSGVLATVVGRLELEGQNRDDSHCT